MTIKIFDPDGICRSACEEASKSSTATPPCPLPTEQTFIDYLAQHFIEEASRNSGEESENALDSIRLTLSVFTCWARKRLASSRVFASRNGDPATMRFRIDDASPWLCLGLYRPPEGGGAA